jgi:tetratricopeptide (TPR) repeat protein
MRNPADYENRRLLAAITGVMLTLAVILTLYVYDRGRPKPETFQELSNRAFSVMDEDLAAALALLDEAIRAEPGNPLGYTNKAVLLSRQELYEDAANAIGRAIRLRPDKPEWYQFQGKCLKKTGRAEESRKAYEKALALYDVRVKEEPKSFDLRYQRERTADLLGDTEAINRLINDLPKYDNPPSATQVRTMMQLDTGQR